MIIESQMKFSNVFQ